MEQIEESKMTKRVYVSEIEEGPGRRLAWVGEDETGGTGCRSMSGRWVEDP